MKKMASLIMIISIFLACLPMNVFASNNNSSYSVTIGNQDLPFWDYPSGSYFTDNGKACTDHNSCDAGYWRNDTCNCKSTWNGVALLSTSCYGFANMVFYRLFGHTTYSNTSKVVSNISAGSNLYNLFSGSSIKPGAHIRTVSGHSMIFMGCDNSYLYTYEGNWGGPCRVSVVSRTWTEFSNYFSEGIAFVEMPNNYPGSSTSKPIAPTNVNVTTSGSKVTVSWDSVENATDYRCEIVKAETGFPLACDPIQTNNTSCEFSLSEGSYYAYVMALNYGVRSEASEWHLFGISNAIPVAPLISGDSPIYNFNGNSTTISWNIVENAEKYSYYLGRHPTGHTYQTPVKSGVTTNTSVTFNDLPVGEYVFFVHAENEFGSSPQSNWISVVINDIDYVPVAIEVYNNRIYALYDNWTTWSYAKQLCEKMGGHLVAITSQDENQFIESFIDKGKNNGYWIGLTDENQNAYDFKWITNEEYEFSDWADGDPNNWGEYGNREDYVQIHKQYNYDWIDTSNYTGTTAGFILEIELENISSTSEKIYNGSKYIIIDHNMTWTEAERYCESLGGHLVTLNSVEEYEFVSNFLDSGKREWYFLGAKKNDGLFKWIDTYENVPISGDAAHWLDGTPTTDANSNYMMMYKGSKNWYELKNYYEYSDHMKHLGFVCEIELPCTQTTVIKSGTKLIIDTKAHNIDSSFDILIVGYKENRFVAMKRVAHDEQNSPYTLEGDIDEIKVMIWDNISNLKPLCGSEEIPSSKWTIE